MSEKYEEKPKVDEEIENLLFETTHFVLGTHSIKETEEMIKKYKVEEGVFQDI